MTIPRRWTRNLVGEGDKESEEGKEEEEGKKKCLRDYECLFEFKLLLKKHDNIRHITG